MAAGTAQRTRAASASSPECDRHTDTDAMTTPAFITFHFPAMPGHARSVLAARTAWGIRDRNASLRRG